MSDLAEHQRRTPQAWLGRSDGAGADYTHTPSLPPFSSNDAQVYSLEAPRGFFLDPSPAATRPLLSWISAIPQPLRETSLLLRVAHPARVEVTAGRSSAQLIRSPTPTCARKELSPHRLPMGGWQPQAAPCGPSWARDVQPEDVRPGLKRPAAGGLWESPSKG